MDFEDTLDETLVDIEPIDTVPDNIALDDEDRTVLTSAAPEHDSAPWPDREWSRNAVYFAAGSTRIAS